MNAVRTGLGFVFLLSAACSDDAAGTAGTGGSGGAGTTATTKTSTIQTVGTGTTKTSSVGTGGEGGGQGGAGGGEGGASQCEVVCDKLENECLLGDVCGPAMGQLFDCSEPEQDECTLACLETHTCGEIQTFAATQQGASMRACTGQCNNALFCKSCVADPNFPNNCTAELGVCANDPACGGWPGCVNNCDTPACFDACDAQYMGASLTALYA
jgi:hypothetical protein